MVSSKRQKGNNGKKRSAPRVEEEKQPEVVLDSSSAAAAAAAGGGGGGGVAMDQGGVKAENGGISSSSSWINQAGSENFPKELVCVLVQTPIVDLVAEETELKLAHRDTPLSEALAMMKEANISALPVLAKNGSIPQHLTKMITYPMIIEYLAIHVGVLSMRKEDASIVDSTKELFTHPIRHVIKGKPARLQVFNPHTTVLSVLDFMRLSGATRVLVSTSRGLRMVTALMVLSFLGREALQEKIQPTMDQHLSFQRSSNKNTVVSTDESWSAFRRMNDDLHHAGMIAVTKEDNILCGVMSPSDLACCLQRPAFLTKIFRPAGALLETIANSKISSARGRPKKVIFISQNELTAGNVIRLMMTNKIHHLPVVTDHSKLPNQHVHLGSVGLPELLDAILPSMP